MSAADSSKAVTAFCVAQTRAMHTEEDFAAKRKPLADRAAEIRTQLRQYLDDHKLTCLALDWPETDAATGQTQVGRMYLRVKHTSTIGTLNLEGIERAVMRVTPDDLKAQYKILQDKKAKEATKKPATKRAKKDTAGASASSEGGEITMLAVWDAVIAVKVREEHLRQSDSLILDAASERSKKGQSDAVAPEAICQLAQEWTSLNQKLAALSKAKSAALETSKAVLAKEEAAVAAYLEKAHPVDKCQEVMLTYKSESRPYMLRKKESHASVPVRITAFKPYIAHSLETLRKEHANELKSFATACSDAVKTNLVEILKQQFTKFQVDHKKPETYVSLDKVPVKPPKADE